MLTDTLVEIEGKTGKETLECSLCLVVDTAVGQSYLWLQLWIVFVVYQIDILLCNKGILIGSKSLYKVRTFMHLMTRTGVCVSS